MLLRREGEVVNHKRVFRVYRAAGLSVKRRQRKRLVPTARGTRFYDEVKHALAGLDNIKRVAAEIRLNQEAELRILAPPYTAHTIVPAALLSGDKQKAFELWLIPPGDKPHSLGLIDPLRPVRITVPKSLLPQVNRDAVLAVSLEPPGGSPTGQPTGPVIANGKLASL